MIKKVNTKITKDIQPYSVILHQCTTRGWIEKGISEEIFTLWPEAYKDYRTYCSWFKDKHENDLLGSFAGFRVKPDLIICSAITQRVIGKSQRVVDLDAWDTVCRKILIQTKTVKLRLNQDWTIHVQYKSNCSQEDWDEIEKIFKKYFSVSKINLVIHDY